MSLRPFVQTGASWDGGGRPSRYYGSAGLDLVFSLNFLYQFNVRSLGTQRSKGVRNQPGRDLSYQAVVQTQRPKSESPLQAIPLNLYAAPE